MAEPYPSKAAWLQASAAAEKVKRLDMAPSTAQAWFPLLRSMDPDMPIGVLVLAEAGNPSNPIPREEMEPVRLWLTALLGDLPVALPPVSLFNLPPQWEIEGRSWQLAALAACISWLLQRPPTTALICSARLSSREGSAGFLPIMHEKAKRTLVQWELPGSEPMLHAGEEDPFPWLEAQFGVDWIRRLRNAVQLSLRAVAESSYRKYLLGERAAAWSLAAPVLKTRGEDPVADIYSGYVIGSLCKHKGRSEDSVAHLRDALSLFREKDRLRDFDLYFPYELAANLGIALLQTLRTEEGIALLEHHLDELDSFACQYRDLRWRDVALRIGGSLRWLYVAAGELGKAEKVQLEWPLSQAAIPRQLCRGWYELADVYWRDGQKEKALKALEQAKTHYPEVLPQARELTLRFMRLVGARLGTAIPSQALGPMSWDSLIQPMECMEFAIHQKPGYFALFVTEHAAVDSLSIGQVYALSGYAARYAAIHGPGEWSAAIGRRLLVHRDRLSPKARRALAALVSGDGGHWARIAPY
jgi:tetratricopeptide (TPR) repeat protein